MLGRARRYGGNANCNVAYIIYTTANDLGDAQLSEVRPHRRIIHKLLFKILTDGKHLRMSWNFSREEERRYDFDCTWKENFTEESKNLATLKEIIG